MSLNAPSPPSPEQALTQATPVANQQQGLNTTAGTESQQGSMVNQANQYGGINYTQTGTGANGVPIYTANVNLDPQQQQLLNTLVGSQKAAGNAGGGLLSAWGANYGGQTPAGAVGDLYSGITNELMGKERAALQPTFDTQTSQLDAQLANQGFTMNDPAEVNAKRNLQLNQDQAVSGFEAQQFLPTMGQANTLYQEPLALAKNIASWTGPTSPTTQTAAAPGLNIQPANLIGATANEAQMLEQQYQNQMQQYSGMMNGLFGIGADALGVMTGGMSLPFTSMAGGMMGGYNGAPGATPSFQNGGIYPMF